LKETESVVSVPKGSVADACIFWRYLKCTFPVDSSFPFS